MLRQPVWFGTHRINQGFGPEWAKYQGCAAQRMMHSPPSPPTIWKKTWHTPPPGPHTLSSFHAQARSIGSGPFLGGGDAPPPYITSRAGICNHGLKLMMHSRRFTRNPTHPSDFRGVVSSHEFLWPACPMSQCNKPTRRYPVSSKYVVRSYLNQSQTLNLNKGRPLMLSNEQHMVGPVLCPSPNRLA